MKRARKKHDHSLQALAIREKTVYVAKRPEVPDGKAMIYLDVEGLPDEDFYYLISLVAVRDGACTSYSFWADDAGQQLGIWEKCARAIEDFGDYTL